MIRLKPKYHQKNFEEISSGFEDVYLKWNPLRNNINISDYFGLGMGETSAVKRLCEDEIISESQGYKGIYIFLKSGTPFYTGISGHIVKRIIQHVKGTNHFSSSLCYRMGADLHLEKNGVSHEGGRKGLNFQLYAEPAKQDLMQCQVSLWPVQDDIELYLFEVYIALKMGTLYYNKFNTH